MYKKATVFIGGVLGILIFFSFKGTSEIYQARSAGLLADTSRWIAPASADTIKNPLVITDAIEDKGAEIYALYCKPCHGETGYGDGAMGAALEIKPANFHSKTFKDQKDGAIFWKLATGRGVMASYKEALTDEQRWQLVAFLRVIPE